MRLIFAGILSLFAAFPLFGEELTLPKTVKGSVASFIVIRANTKGELVQWYSVTPGLSVFPSEMLSDKKTTVVIAQKDGKYRLIAWTAVDGKPTPASEVIVEVGQLDPDPPGPVPPFPGPVTQFERDLQDAFVTDGRKLSQVADLRKLHLLGVALVKDSQLKTAGELFSRLKLADGSLLPADALPKMRQRIGTFLESRLPTDPEAVLTEEIRARGEAAFREIEVALSKVQ